MRLFPIPLLLVLTQAALAACAPFPKVPGPGPDAGPTPALVPIDDLLAQADSFGPAP